MAADHILPGHGVVQTGYDRANQFRNYIEELTAMVESGKKAGKSLAELQKTITPSSLKTLQANGYGSYVMDNTQKFSVYTGSRTALEDRLSANVDAVYKNLDKT